MVVLTVPAESFAPTHIRANSSKSNWLDGRFCGRLAGAALGGAFLAGGPLQQATAAGSPAHAGPGTRYQPTIRVAFVRRKGPYGMRWPGAVYDGEAALARYREQITATAESWVSSQRFARSRFTPWLKPSSGRSRPRRTQPMDSSSSCSIDKSMPGQPPLERQRHAFQPSSSAPSAPRSPQIQHIWPNGRAFSFARRMISHRSPTA